MNSKKLYKSLLLGDDFDDLDIGDYALDAMGLNTLDIIGDVENEDIINNDGIDENEEKLSVSSDSNKDNYEKNESSNLINVKKKKDAKSNLKFTFSRPLPPNNDKQDKHDNLDKVERIERTERVERKNKPDKFETLDKIDRLDKSIEKLDGLGRSVDKFEKIEKLDRSEKSADIAQKKAIKDNTKEYTKDNAKDNNKDKHNSNNKDHAQLFNSYFDTKSRKLENESDLKMTFICESNGEKIYQLSDLFIPVEERILKRIIKYNLKKMNLSEKENKDKIEKEDGVVKKEVNEIEELKNLFNKARKNQKFMKINFSHNEKYFDKTFNLENINNNNTYNEEIRFNNNNKNIVKNNIFSQEEYLQKQEQRSISNDLVEKNLLNSLYSVKMKLKNSDEAKNKENKKPEKPVIIEEDFENSQLKEINLELTKLSTNALNIHNDEIKKKGEEREVNKNEKEYEKGMSEDINDEISPIGLNDNLDNHIFNNNIFGNNSMFHHDEINENSKMKFSESKKENELLNNDHDLLFMGNNYNDVGGFGMEEDFLSPHKDRYNFNNLNNMDKHNNNINGINNLSSINNLTNNNLNNNLNFNMDNSIHSYSERKNNQDSQFNMFGMPNENNITNKNSKNEFQFKVPSIMLRKLNKPDISSQINLSYDVSNSFYIPQIPDEENNTNLLFDKYKKAKNQQIGYVNKHLVDCDFLKGIITDSHEINPLFKDYAKRIYDQNDYNMNFENAVPQKSQKKNESFFMQDDFLSALNSNKLNTANQNVATSGNKMKQMKTNLFNHAKCAINLTYNKINLNNDDLRDFHRPNFCKFLLKEKKKMNLSIKIYDEYNISDGENIKRWKASVVSRKYLKMKEKKRISKNIQYMNAYEIFKDRYKLSLTEGKFVLMEHVDENPLFLSNFGMASKIKKFLYSNKLLNANITKEPSPTEVELKTYSIIGPYGFQIPLQSNQKMPLVGQIDQNELKGLAVVDNKMYRSPIFYEKISNALSSVATKSNKIVINTDSTNDTAINKSKIKMKIKKNIPYPTPNVAIEDKDNQKNKDTKKYMNFLITFKKKKDGKEAFVIREIDHLYGVAQEEPKIEVYPPQSRQYISFLKKKIQTYTYKLYDQVGYKNGINFKMFSTLFPNVTEQILKKNFREMRIEIDKNTCYFTKNPNEENQLLISPENVCQYESCQHGMYKLRELGIKNLSNSDKISYATNKYIQRVI